ncbi:MFS transporter, arabinose efflux permease AraJ [Thermobacillus xylanilyticus]|uniref:MFS transporter, arabinose efflux permease AraJ n=1 Tax=Thermobacillus xylanilyticus TaxID=76633 RepID=A0ABM8V1N5_THEXY|nr:MFS transporter [Thermobacillus xylanilyticus]CAG5081443.1 MFS transporter, arabinose efflux permease AraJ [Thermobacillus xylanilyticus]
MNCRILLLTAGMFVIGTEAFMIAGLLPALARDLEVSVSAAGQLVTVFSLAYAFGSPILATLTGKAERRKLLSGAMLLFAVGNALCGLANVYWLVFLGRVITAAGAGLFAPSAAAAASALSDPDHRGRSLSLVLGGATVALILGVPAGTWLAYMMDWRLPFRVVAGLSAAAAAGIRLFFPKVEPPESVSMRERLSQLKRPLILSALAASLTWGTGVFLVYTYIADIFGQFGAAGRTVSFVLLLTGLASFAGVQFGGYAVDRYGSHNIIVLTLFLLMLAVIGLSLLHEIPGYTGPLLLGGASMALWGFSGYAFNPAQQHRLIGISGTASGIVLSLHNSAIYFGTALGAMVGGLVLDIGGASDLGCCSAGAFVLALIAHGASRRLAVRAGGASGPS